MKKQFAVFDIDGTVSRTSLLQLTVRELVARGRLDVGPARQIETILHSYREHIDDPAFANSTKRATETMFKGLSKGLRIEEYNEIVDAIVKTSLTDTYVYTRELVQTLRQNGFFLIAISNSEVRAVSTFAKALGFDAWVGEISYIEEKGRFKGQIQTLRQTKSQILSALVQKFDLEMRGSTAVGDTAGDISVLEMVESPIVFNPNQALFKIARSKGWMVVLERKDMVYGLTPSGNSYVLKQTNV